MAVKEKENNKRIIDRVRFRGRKIIGSITVKSNAVVTTLLIIFGFIVATLANGVFKDAMLQQYSEGAFQTAYGAALYLNPNRIDKYMESEGKTYEYRKIIQNFDELCELTGSTFVYVIIPDRTDYGHITFLLSGAKSDIPYDVYEFGYVRETTNDEYREKYRQLCEGEIKEALVIRDVDNVETDSHITAIIPLVAFNGEVTGLLCVQRQLDILDSTMKEFTGKLLVTLITLLIVLLIVQTIINKRLLIKPVQVITKEASRFADENVLKEVKLQDVIHNHDEIGLLASSIDYMEEKIDDYVHDLTRITAESERLNTELELAKHIQEDTLPNDFLFPDRDEVDIYASMDPAREVGGDFYDFFFIDEDHLCLVIADVSGKGIPAALFMMAVKTILANSAKLGRSPREIMEGANDYICSNRMEEMFITAWLGILEISTGRITASNAGHEYPILMQPGGKFELIKDKHGFVVGGLEGVKYNDYEIQLQPGATLFLYTDGLPEAMNREGKMFGTDRITERLNEKLGDEAAGSGPQAFLEDMKSAVNDFVNDAEQFDDMTMLCIRYNGVSRNYMKEITVPAIREKVELVTDFINAELEKLGCPMKMQMQIDVALDEIFGNIVHYAYRRGEGSASVRFEFDTDQNAVVLTFTDNGMPYNPLEKEDPDITLSAEEREVGGLGIFLVKKIMDDMSYEYKDGKNILQLKKYLNQ